MQKKWPIVVTLLLISALAFWFLKSPPRADDPSSAPDKDAEASLLYDTRVIVKQRVEGQGEALVIDIKGQMNQFSQVGSLYLSQWQSLDNFVLMNQAQDKSTQDSIVGKSIESRFDPTENAFAHAFPPDFPKDLLPFHASLMHRTLLPLKLDELRRVETLALKERDEVGEYEAIYSIQGLVVTKRWNRYLNEHIKVDGRLNRFVYTFKEDGTLAEVKGDLTLHYRQSTPTRFQIMIEMKLAGPSERTVAQVDPKSAIRYSEADIAKGVEGAPASIVSYEEAFRLVDTITDASDSTEAFRIFSSLKYSIDQDPSRAAEVIAKIKATTERDPSSRRRLSVLFGALAQAKDSGISTSLAEMAESCPDNYCKIQAIAGVNSHPNPSSEALDKMLQLSTESSDAEISGNALLAAGAAGSRIDGASPELSDTLIKAANNPAKAEIKEAALAAMGNHGSTEYLPVLTKNLTDPSSTARAAAAYSLRYIPDPSVDQTLLNVVSQDKDQMVIRDALKALDYRSLSVDDYESVAKAAGRFTDPETQKIGARVLIQAYREDPSVASAAINSLKDAVTDPDVKEYLSEEVQKIDQDRAAALAPAPTE